MVEISSYKACNKQVYSYKAAIKLEMSSYTAISSYKANISQDQASIVSCLSFLEREVSQDLIIKYSSYMVAI